MDSCLVGTHGTKQPNMRLNRHPTCKNHVQRYVSAILRGGHQGEPITVREMVFSDDRRLFRYDEVRFEQLGGVRLKTTAVVAGMANRSKLHAFILEKEAGQVVQREQDVEVGGTITSYFAIPVLTGIPLVVGRKPQLWIENLEAHWAGLIPKFKGSVQTGESIKGDVLLHAVEVRQRRLEKGMAPEAAIKNQQSVL